MRARTVPSPARHRRAPALLLAAALAAGLTACSSSGGSAVTGEPSTTPAGSASGSSGAGTATSATGATTAAPSTATGTGTATATATSAPTGLRGRVIVIDPGHNGGNGSHPAQINKLVNVINGYKACNTAGTQTNAGYEEHAFTWDVANRLAALLRAAGAKVVLTRDSDTGVGPCVDERARIGNRAHADLALSIHADGVAGTAAGSAYGFHVIEPGSVGPNAAIVAPSRQLGTAIRDAFRAGTGEPVSTYTAHDGLITRTDLGGLNVSTVPVVMIECGDMRNAADASRLTSSAWRQRAAQALLTGMAAYLSAR